MDRRLVLAAAALVLLAGLVGVLAFTGGDSQSQPLAYDVSWPVEPGPSRMRSGELQEGRNDSYTLELDRENVTQVSVELNWTDDVGEPDRFRLWVLPPNASAASNESTNGSITLAFDYPTLPDTETITAPNRSQAREHAMEYSTSEGTGDWSVRVTLVNAPGRQPVPDAPQLETEPDGSNSYNLTFSHDAFRAEIGQPGPPGT